MLPSATPASTAENTRFCDAASGTPSAVYSGRRRQTRLPARLNSGEITLAALVIATAKETKVGGTSSCSKEPLIESLPPMAPTPKSNCAANAPSSAANGLPQRAGSFLGFSKNS